MPCDFDSIPGAILCSKTPRRRCVVCGQLGADRLCDAKVSVAGSGLRKRTCDRPLHRRCARSEGQADFCPTHPGEGQQRELFR